MKKFLASFCFLFLTLASLKVQAFTVRGKVMMGESPIANATIRVKSSTYGVVSNHKGEYYMDLSLGSHTLICEFIGFKPVERTIYVKTSMVVDFELHQENEVLNEVTIDKNREDPAVAIMRSAIEKAKELRKQELADYSHKLYLKITVEREDLRVKDSSTDLTSKEHVNFIESLSNVYYKDAQIKEVKHAYKELAPEQRSGNVQVRFSDSDPTQPSTMISRDVFYTKVTDGDFNLLQPRMDLPLVSSIPVTSPLSPSAFLNYRFNLLETFYDSTGRAIAKIRVRPILSESPLLEGEIYVSRNDYILLGSNLSFTKSALSFYNAFRFVQEYNLIGDTLLVVDRQEFYYNVQRSKNVTSYGTTLAVFSDYQTGLNLSPKFMRAGQVIYTDSSYDVSQEAWENIRPVGLKELEQNFVHVQDSIRDYKQSDAYLREQDSIYNHLDIWSFLLNGIYHRNRQKGIDYSIYAITQQIRINNIDGYRHTFGGRYAKEWSKSNEMELFGEIGYGFANENVRGNIQARYLYQPKQFGRVRVAYRNQYGMINSNSNIAGTLSPSNFAENIGYGIGHEKEWKNGFFVQAYLDYNEYAPFKGVQLDELWDYFPSFNKAQDFEPFEELILKIDARITFRQQYELKPHKKIITGTKYPILNLHYEKGIKPFFGSDVNYDFVELSTAYKFKLFKMGTTRTEFHAGRFINDREVRLSALKYIRGSDNYYFSNPLRTPQLIESQGYQTAKAYAQAGIMHHFDGQILRKVPLINRLRLGTAVGAHGLWLEGGYVSQDNDNLIGSITHTELIAGLEKKFRLWKQQFRFGTYYAISQNNQFGFNQGIKFGIDFYNPINNLWQY